jgi:hypothetical protein
MSWNVADHLLDVVNMVAVIMMVVVVVVVVVVVAVYLLRMDIHLLQMWVTVVQCCTSNNLPN